MADEDIGTLDIPPLSADFFARAALKLPITDKSVVAVRLDTDTLEWFQNQGEKAENQMAIALRLYAETHREKPVQGP